MSGAEAIPIIKRLRQQYEHESHPLIGIMEASYISSAYAEIIREASRNRSADILVTLDRFAKRMDSAACDSTFRGRYSGHIFSVMRDVAVDTYDIFMNMKRR